LKGFWVQAYVLNKMTKYGELFMLMIRYELGRTKSFMQSLFNKTQL